MPRAAPYGSRIAEHFRRPHNQGALVQPAASAEGANPLCGDRVRIELALTADRTSIADARFTANACAICIASASLLTDRLRGLTRDAAAAIGEAAVIGDLEADIPVGRRRCATLPLEAAQRALATIPRADTSGA